MEFTAYDQARSSRKPGFSMRKLWKVQNVLHSSDSIALPGLLLAIASALVIYQFMTEEETGRHTIKTFLAKLLVSMLPLVVLETKFLSFPDPVGLMSRFSIKVLLMHACFLSIRAVCFLLPDGFNVGHRYCNTAAFIAAVVLLPTVFGFRPTPACLRQHTDVWLLAFVAFCVAVCEVVLLTGFQSHTWRINWKYNPVLQDVLATGSDYIEIVSFVPAVWMVHRKEAPAGTEGADAGDSCRRALALFAFIICFYSVEDVFSATQEYSDFPFAAMGHIAHFLMLGDFALFLLAHLCDPEKLAQLKGPLISWMVDVCTV